MPELDGLTRREREIMDIIYELGVASVRDLMDRMQDPPTDSAIRTMVSRLEKKGHLQRRQEGLRNVYLPTTPRRQARRSAVTRLLRTFFDGSVEQAVSALLSRPGKLDEAELDRIAELIEKKRREMS